MNKPIALAQMEALAELHYREEVANNVEAVMDTLCEDPHYEFYPMGLRIRGRAAVEEMYRRMLVAPIARTPLELRPRKRTAGPDGLMSEDEATIRDDEGKLHRVAAVSVYSFEGTLMKGERVYLNDAGAALTMQALGPDFLKMPGVDWI